MALIYDEEANALYRRSDGSLWHVIGYQPSPTMILECVASREGVVKPGTRETHAVGCANAEDFTKLVPAKET